MKYWQKAIQTKLLCVILSIVIAHLAFCSDVLAQNFGFEGKRTKDAISFEFTKNLIIVPVYINNRGPFNFILDTGVGPMIITNPKLKDSLRLSEPRPIKITGFGAGEEIDAFVAKTSSITLGNALGQNLSVIVLKEDFFSLSDYVGKEISGLIGYDFFNSFIVKINYSGHRISFNLHGRKSKIKGEKIPIELIDKKPYLTASLEAENYGKLSVKLIIDCGASHALSLETVEGKGFNPPKANILGNLGVGLSGEISGMVGRVSSLSIGSYAFTDVLANFPKYNDVAAKSTFKGRNGNLGAEILKRFNVTFDYQNQQMYLQKNELFNRPFEHDMSGMEIYVMNRPYNSFFVGRIEPESPAEKADFHINDEIISINFKRVQEYSIDEVNELLKAGNGKAVIIEIFRDKKIMVKLIKLSKRV